MVVRTMVDLHIIHICRKVFVLCALRTHLIFKKYTSIIFLKKNKERDLSANINQNNIQQILIRIQSPTHNNGNYISVVGTVSTL